MLLESIVLTTHTLLRISKKIKCSWQLPNSLFVQSNKNSFQPVDGADQAISRNEKKNEGRLWQWPLFKVWSDLSVPVCLTQVVASMRQSFGIDQKIPRTDLHGWNDHHWASPGWNGSPTSGLVAAAGFWSWDRQGIGSTPRDFAHMFQIGDGCGTRVVSGDSWVCAAIKTNFVSFVFPRMRHTCARGSFKPFVPLDHLFLSKKSILVLSL